MMRVNRDIISDELETSAPSTPKPPKFQMKIKPLAIGDVDFDQAETSTAGYLNNYKVINGKIFGIVQQVNGVSSAKGTKDVVFASEQVPDYLI